MLGYMTEKEAKENGFTHHGSYFGIPCWITDDEAPMVATKWAPMELLMDMFHVIENLQRTIFYPDDEPCFQFQVGKEIE